MFNFVFLSFSCDVLQVFIPLITTFNLTVDFPIPDCLLKEEDKSNHASTMFNEAAFDVGDWFTSNLVSPLEWILEHPDDIPFGASNTFEFLLYCEKFRCFGLKLWDIQNKQHATSYLQLTSNMDGKTTLIAGRADFLVTHANVTMANYLNEMLCVIEIQSKASEVDCELQMLVYLLILMNTKHLKKLVGFLVYKNGQCRAFKASRDIGSNCVYEMNELFHVSYIADILKSILLAS
jgi:hypothetical protein